MSCHVTGEKERGRAETLVFSLLLDKRTRDAKEEKQCRTKLEKCTTLNRRYTLTLPFRTAAVVVVVGLFSCLRQRPHSSAVISNG